MERITFAIAVIAAVASWRSSPLRALSVYFAVLLLYPQFLTLKIGSLDFNTGRILILVLFAKLLLQTRLLQDLRWTNLDRLVLLLFASRIVAMSVNAPIELVLVREGGFIVSVLMPYIAIRAIVTTKQDFRNFVQGLIFIGMILAVLGGYESVTGHNPMGFMKSYGAWEAEEYRPLGRYGLYRADVSFGQYIAFGLFFTPLFALSLALYKGDANPLKTIVVPMVLLIGIVSSVSSAPLLAFVLTSAIIAFFPFRKYSILAIGMLIGSLAFLEYYSDRHFYEVMTRLAMSSATASYRVGLFEEAFGGGMDGHWLFGYGYVGFGPGNDNTNFLWEHQDLVNIYIARLARIGLFGTVPFLIVNVMYYRYLYRAWGACKSLENRRIVWCLTAALIGWNVAMMTVNTVSLLGTLLYALIALAASLPRLVAEETEQSEERISGESSLMLGHDGGAPGNGSPPYQEA